jgi:predicted lipoprotein with Yx(FWY)xxD motif
MVRKFTLSALGVATLLIAGCAIAAAPGKATNGVLVGDNGMTLYTFDKDAPNAGKSVCNGGCAANWPPLAAPASAKTDGPWTVVTRDDGSKQWAYKGQPVYYWVKDKAVGDKTGDGVGGVWHVAKP